jgi:lysine biosynthesis protein LysW
VEGEFVTCSSCGADLEVVSLEPVELDWAYLEPVERKEEWVWGENRETPRSFPAWDWMSQRDL